MFEDAFDCAQYFCPQDGEYVSRIVADSPVPIIGSMLSSPDRGCLRVQFSLRGRADRVRFFELYELCEWQVALAKGMSAWDVVYLMYEIPRTRGTLVPTPLESFGTNDIHR